MAEKQPTAYVVCRFRIDYDEDDNITNVGDNIPVKVFDTRSKARDYCKRMSKRSRRYDYNYYPVKQG